MSILSPEEFAAIDVDNLLFEGGREVEVEYDRRFDSLSPRCRKAVADYFNGNIDEAVVAAERRFQNFRRNAEWVAELRAAGRRRFQELP